MCYHGFSSGRKRSGRSRRCPSFTMPLLMLLALRNASSAAAAVQVSGGGVLDLASDAVVVESRRGIPMAPEAYHLDPHGSGSRGDDTMAAPHAGTERMTARKLASGNSKALPRGYEKKLKIAVPHKHGFQAFVNVSNQNFIGYCIDFFEAAAKKLPHHLSYEFISFAGSYDQLALNVSLGHFDAAVGDVTITAERASRVDFTMPYTESGVSLLVLTENDSKSTIEWEFLKPLTKELWFATVGFFFITGFVVLLIERPRNVEYQGSTLRQFSTALYFSFSTLTFSHGQIIRSPLSKIVVVIWCFVVMILVQSYTASLSSILTANRLRPSVTDLDQLLINGDYVGYQDGSFVHSVLRNRGFSEKRLRPYTKKEEYAGALRNGSKNGGVSAIVDEIPYLTSFLSDHRYQNEFQMVNRIYKTPGFGFVFPQGSPLVHDLSTAILDLTGGDEGSRIEAKWLGTGTPSPSYGCPNTDSTPLTLRNGCPNTDSTPLTLRSFSGLFIITGCISALMLLIRIARSVHAKYTKVRDSDMHSADGDGGSVDHEESRPVQNGMGNGPVTDQPHHEARNDNSQDVHGSSGSAHHEGPNRM